MLNKVVAAHQHGPAALAEMMLACTDEQLRAFGHTGDVAELRHSFEPWLAWSNLSRAERRRTFGAKEAAALRGMVSEALEGVDRGPQGFTATVDRLIDGSGGRELLEAINAGIVTIPDSPFELSGNTDDQVQQFTEELARQIEEPGSYLLFDESVSSLTHAMVEEGLAVPHVLTVTRRSRRSPRRRSTATCRRAGASVPRAGACGGRPSRSARRASGRARHRRHDGRGGSRCHS